MVRNPRGSSHFGLQFTVYKKLPSIEFSRFFDLINDVLGGNFGIFYTNFFPHQNFWIFLHQFLITPKILLFFTSILLHQKICFLHQFCYTKNFAFFTAKILLFLHQTFYFFSQQFCYTKNFAFFTPKILVFFTPIFLHQKFFPDCYFLP
mgnify:CR=1 FL=1